MTTKFINHVALFKRNLLVERTQSVLDRAKTSGKTLEYPNVLSDTLKIRLSNICKQTKLWLQPRERS